MAGVANAIGLGIAPPAPAPTPVVRDPNDEADDIASRRRVVERRRRGTDDLRIKPSGLQEPAEGTGLSI